MRTIRRISVGSAFKVGLVLGALVFAVLGVFVVLLPGLFGASLLGAMGGGRSAGAGFLGALVFYCLGIVGYGIGGGIAGFLNAALYNIVAGWVGGIEVDVS